MKVTPHLTLNPFRVLPLARRPGSITLSRLRSSSPNPQRFWNSIRLEVAKDIDTHLEAGKRNFKSEKLPAVKKAALSGERDFCISVIKKILEWSKEKGDVLILWDVDESMGFGAFNV